MMTVAENQTGSLGNEGKLYDKAGRMIAAATLDGEMVSYVYNANGSRMITYYEDGTREDYTYDKAGNVLSVIHRDSNGNFLDAYIYRYDEDNNLIFENKTAGTTVYTYDSFNRLISVKQGDTTSSYTYDDADYRTSSTVNGTKEYSCYENGKLKAEADSTGTVTAVNHYGLVLFARDTLTESYYYLYNAHRDIVMLVYTQGGIAATYQYDAFGNILKATGTADNTTTYAGYQYDESTGLYYVNARYYDSTTARFLTEDRYTGEKNDPLSLNRYTYCANNPLKYYDPSGHVAMTVDEVWGNVAQEYGWLIMWDGPLPFGDILYGSMLFMGTLYVGSQYYILWHDSQKIDVRSEDAPTPVPAPTAPTAAKTEESTSPPLHNHRQLRMRKKKTMALILEAMQNQVKNSTTK